ncbi:MAG: hypothetical protein A3A58_01120 [Candidatus Blackburnbacteria bacterium RIFCSPLOWO2_01_FULL_41_27]|uniref:Restriction endonuclease n=1 Tax=Candidatus Blackburnbacteria bacterium RIFCSPLOWO2_01_FULL_41_27 TaxID=1797520 RepID=A0A1G1VHJ2_9BACT|nr:MAG: hypothetical protein A3A58_01120 [Candidatus Blackburnbacteria bacterium RIFCSPLOWO2_01_FULL_41_27]
MSKKSNIFYSEIYKKLEQKILEVLNGQPDFLSVSTVNSPRAVGDAVQDILAVNFEKIIDNLGLDYSAKFARRAMADLAFKDKDGFYYVVDVKTHRLDTVFNMPNLTSVERLARFYEDDSNYFVILKVDYEVTKTKAVIKKVHFVPIEFLSWKCLTIGALGWGQIQIANSNNIKLIPQNSRKKWMIQLCNNLFEFYPNEISKINERILYFKKVKAFWKKKTE